MKNPSWNLRGVGREGFIQEVRKLVNLYYPDILIFMKTKVNSIRAKKVNQLT